MREKFNRNEDGQLVNIEVYLDAKENQENNPWIYSVFIKYDVSDKSEDSLDEFFETKESLIIALEYENRASYVGNRIVGDWSELYFYANNTKQLDAITSKILKSSGYTFDTNNARDKEWGFFDHNIFPTDLELSLIQSAQIVELMKEEGDDSSIPREVEHYASFDTSTQKSRFVENALECGFEFKDDISSDELEYGVALTKNHSLLEEDLREAIEPLLEFIAEERGEYELWSTTLANISE
ncbi:DUF695 domain-containing protein [Sulfurimonas sp.]|nr:DUF695 domain-containing protein [Sulfurimonas sp.]